MSVAPEGAWMNSPKVPRVPPPQHVQSRRMLGTPVPPWATFCRPPRGASARNPPFRKGGAPAKAKKSRSLVDFFMRQKRRDFVDARKLLMSMTFARRNGLLAPDNLLSAGRRN